MIEGIARAAQAPRVAPAICIFYPYFLFSLS
jgi:hypothetical protein